MKLSINIYILLICLIIGDCFRNETKLNDNSVSINYENYLITSTIYSEKQTRKFIVDLLWRGLSKISRSNNENRTQCLNILDEYVNGVIGNKKVWALKMYDSSSGEPPGFLTGNIQEIGSYDECVDISTPKVNGKYCKILLNDSSSPLENHLSLKDVHISYSLCVPSKCSADDIQQILNEGKKFICPNLFFSANEMNCSTKTEKSYDVIDWVAIFIFSSVCGICILSTIYHLCNQTNTKGKLIISCFSLKRNCEGLFKIEKGEHILGSIYGLRFIIMLWIILIHRFTQVHNAPAMGLFKWNTILQDWTRTFIVNGFICVDTYFVFGGLLLSYNFLVKCEKINNYSYLRLYLHRYIRLTPALAAIVLLYSTLSDQFVEGPMSNNFNAAIKKPCTKNWWAALTYINNYYDTDDMCGIQTWYTSIDMQLYLLSPGLLYPLVHYPWVTPYLFSCLIVVSVVISIVQPKYNHIYAGYFIFGGYEDHRGFLENYIFTHTRIVSWLIGFAVGIYLFNFKKNNFSLTKKSLTIGWLLTGLTFIGVIFSILPLQQETHKYNALWDSLYKALHRHLWALASSWLIFACCTGYGGFVNDFLSWDGFQPLGRLTYCIHLTHILIIKLQMVAQRTPVNFTDMTRITQAFGDIAASILSAAVLYLLFEAPAIALENVISCSDTKGEKEDSEENEMKNRTN